VPDPCAGFSCGNGVCIAPNGRPICECDPGFKFDAGRTFNKCVRIPGSGEINAESKF